MYGPNHAGPYNAWLLLHSGVPVGANVAFVAKCALPMKPD